MEENNHCTEVVSPLELSIFIDDCRRGQGKFPFHDLTVRTFKTFEFRHYEQKVITVFQFLQYAESIHIHLSYINDYVYILKRLSFSFRPID